MKLMAKLMAVILLVGLTLPAFGFDTEPGKFKEFEPKPGFEGEVQYVDVSDIVTKVTLLGTGEGFIPEFENGKLIAVRAVGVFGQEGSCFYVGSHGNRHLFVTNAHVVTPGALIIQESKFASYVTEPVKIISQMLTVGQNTGLGSAPAEVVYCNIEQDIAIIAVIGNWQMLKLVEAPYQPVWTFYDRTSLIHEGDSVATIVAQRPWINEDNLTKGVWFEVRYGKVLHDHPYIPENCPLPHWFVSWFHLGDITTNMMIYPGDSGSPVFAFSNGKPVIVGVARAAGYFETITGEYVFLSYFTRIDVVIRFVLEK